jgi:pimeloyl-ACP methyl ester carboxylesterase
LSLKASIIQACIFVHCSNAKGELMDVSSTVSELVATPSATIETLVQGEGPVLVVLPSYGRDGVADFDQFANVIARAGMRVLRPQPRGIGRSKGGMRASLQDMADDVAEVIRQFGAGRAAVLGHAFGNGVARLLAATHQDLVEGTILAAASTDGASKETNETPFIAGDPSRSESERLEALSRGFFAPHHDPRPWLEGWYPATLQMQKEAVHGVKPELFSKAGTAPILQIIAESDPFSPYESWRALRDECGDRVTARIVADASHALFPEQTPNVAELVIQWLTWLRSRPHSTRSA